MTMILACACFQIPFVVIGDCRNCSSKFLRLLTNGKPQELNSFAPSGWDSPPLAECDSLSTQQLSCVELDLDIAKFEFNMTDDEIRYFFADSTNDGGLPRSRQEDGLSHQVQE